MCIFAAFYTTTQKYTLLDILNTRGRKIRTKEGNYAASRIFSLSGEFSAGEPLFSRLFSELAK